MRLTGEVMRIFEVYDQNQLVGTAILSDTGRVTYGGAEPESVERLVERLAFVDDVTAAEMLPKLPERLHGRTWAREAP